MTTQNEQTMPNNPDRLLAGRVVLITGASRGIGAATATLLARHGAAIGVNYVRNQKAAEHVVDSIVAEGGRAIPIKADVSNQHEVEEMIRRVTGTLGSIDTLVLNAVPAVAFSPIKDLTWEQLGEGVTSELRGVFYPVKAVLPAMLERQNGCIIAVSSSLSRQVRPGSAVLSTAKAALDAFVRTLAAELGSSGIRANLVAPGIVATDSSQMQIAQRAQQIIQITPLGRIAQPEDIAGAILLLASEQAQFITGAYLPVTGGMFMA